MLNNCTIVIITQWNQNACNCYNEKTRLHFHNKVCYKVTRHYISCI